MICPYCNQEKGIYGLDTFRCLDCGDAIFWIKNGKIIEAIITKIMVKDMQFTITIDYENPYVLVQKVIENTTLIYSYVFELDFIPPNWNPTNMGQKIAALIVFS